MTHKLKFYKRQKITPHFKSDQKQNQTKLNARKEQNLKRQKHLFIFICGETLFGIYIN